MMKRIFLLTTTLLCLVLIPATGFSQSNQGPLININCENAGLKDVIDTIGSIWGIDIIYGNEVAEKMAPPVKLTNVSCAKALGIILDLQGFAYEWEENLIRVKRKPKALKATAEEKVVTQIYILKNVKAEEIAASPSLKELLTESGKIIIDEKLNALSVTDIESNVGTIIAFIRRLDEGEKVTKIVRLNFATASSVAGSGILTKLLSETGGIETDSRTNSLIITDSKANIKKIEEFVKKIDLPTPQVMIEATILEANYLYTRDLGITWSVAKELTAPSGGRAPYTVGVTLPAAGPVATFSVGSLTQNQFNAVITALESKTDTKILSNPRIATIDNQQAIIKVGKSIPILTTTVSGGVVTTSTSYIDTSVTLTVTPQITPEGDVTLTVNPRVVDSMGTDLATGSPILATSEATTTVLVKSGHTVVIGGLLKETSPTAVSKVPILGDIPIFGWLFKRKRIGETEKRDLIIFITPRVIRRLEKPPEEKLSIQ